MSTEKKWKEFNRRVADAVGDPDFKRWFRPMRFVGFSGHQIIFKVPNDTYVLAIRENFSSLLRGIVKDVYGFSYELTFALDEEPKTSVQEEGASLNFSFTFDSFVVGDSNQFVHAAARAVAENPATSYNPLFIYGDSGLGKTHLMHAIGHHVLQTTKLKVVYVPIEDFYTDLVNAIRHRKILEFRNNYRKADVLLLDDIQFLGTKERTQEEVFHTFNSLYDNHKQVVLASDRLPREIEKLEERLRSRFEWGLLADIQPPDLEMKVAILKKKAAMDNIHLPDPVALFISQLMRSNIRDLEGLYRRVVAYASLTGLELDCDVARLALKNIINLEDTPVSPQKITRVVAHYYGLKISDIKGKSNAKTFAFPRQIAMWIIKQTTNMSYPEIGKLFGNKHHSTVIYSVDKIEKLRLENSDFRKTLEELMDGLR